ncbi:MAG: tetratricopeptide repeat protein [bacterium]|nr:tetratricopeptide repeat protein [bacterium]
MKKGTIFTAVTAVILIFGLTVSSLDAQAGRGRGRLKGKVIFKDTKKPVTGADVMIYFAQDEKLKYEDKTDKKGEWAFIGLGTGQWRITASFPGYIPDKQQLKVSQFTNNPYLVLKLEKATKKVLSENAGLVEQGNEFFGEGKYAEALEAFKGFHEKTPEFFEVFINIANCYMKLEKYDEAIAEYNKFLEEAKKKNEKKELQAQALAAIGEIYVKRNDMEKAQEFFVKSIELDPKDEILAYNVAEIFFGNGKSEEAAKYYQIASQIKPTWGVPYLKLGYTYLALGDMKKAVEFFNKFIEVDPENPEVPNIKEVIKGLEGM